MERVMVPMSQMPGLQVLGKRKQAILVILLIAVFMQILWMCLSHYLCPACNEMFSVLPVTENGAQRG